MKVLLCTFWGMEHVRSVKRPCSECGTGVAMDAHNVDVVAEKGLRPICATCFLRLSDPECGGAIIGGEEITFEPNTALVRAVAKTLVAQRKQMLAMDN
jgi:ribosomal protein S27AE